MGLRDVEGGVPRLGQEIVLAFARTGRGVWGVGVLVVRSIGRRLASQRLSPMLKEGELRLW